MFFLMLDGRIGTEMKHALTNKALQQQTLAFRGSGGISAESRSVGFRPAFLDVETGAVYDSRDANGRPAPVHLLDGLPRELVLTFNAAGRVIAVKDSVIAGFVRQGRFYTREEAASLAIK